MLGKIAEKIRTSKNFLITAHVNLEGDALGSELAMYALLKKLRKNVVICNNDPTPQIYSFLPYSGVVKNTITEEKFDVVLALDCSDSFRAGKVSDYLCRADCIVNIDHHISNTFFGDINWVESKASSTCQMIYGLCNKLGVMNKEIALCLYTGIFTDTGNFTYANTNSDTHKVVTELMKYNINPHIIYGNIHSLCDFNDLRFMSKIISSLKFDSRRKICWAKIKKWEDKGYDLTEVIFSVMRLLKDVEVFILFKKLERNKVRVNFRSRYMVDVNRIARFFGGGGHKRASGTTLECAIDAAERKIIPFVRRYTKAIKIEERRKIMSQDRRFRMEDRRQSIGDRRFEADRRDKDERRQRLSRRDVNDA